MNRQEKEKVRRKKIKHRIRKKVTGTPERPRLSIYRSANHIYAQFIDDINSKTIFTVSDLSKDVAGQLNDAKTSIEKSKLIGKAAVEKANANNIEQIVFDRNGYLYHGRVKALADGLREGGLKF